MGKFPSMRWRDMYRLLAREPLNYREARRAGSHRWLVSDGYPPLILGGHESETCSPNAVRKILMIQVGLTEEEARRLV
jgi:predicted RNA binding protein YcfA (HicA-like mRNA interferase family)